MSRGPAPFKQRDVTRVLKGTIAAGIKVQSVEIDKAGKIIVITTKPSEASIKNAGVDDWDTL